MLPSMLLFLATLTAPAHAADAVAMRAVHTVTYGQANPSLTLDTAVSGAIQVRLHCAGRPFSLDTAIAPGGSYTLELRDLPRGEHSCTGQLALQAADGTSGQMPLNLSVGLHEPPDLTVDPSDLDLQARTLVLRSSRPLSDIQIDVFGPGNERIGGARAVVQGQDRVALEWASEGEIVRIDVLGTDADGIAAKLELIPWSYAIPHEDVIFASGSHTIDDEQAPKLEQAWSELEAVLVRYGSVVQVRLYVAGYTDTVGSAATNQALSERRARSIAAWFRDRGFEGTIAYQGFGESALAVATPDSTDQAANRRALYILAARPPAPSGDLPRADWKPLR